MPDLSLLDATAQAELVARGEASPRELVDAAIARIESCNPQLNAVIHERFERARAEAPTATGRFAGVPFLVKDAVCHTAGDPYHAGMRALKNARWTAPDDTWLAVRFRNAGFVFVGKTNTPELATSITTEPLAYGATHNPWDLDRSPGGSSGGSAAAVASGLVPVAHGNDMGGSIRFPAAMCGIVGLKPTRARTTLGPHFGEYWGPLTHEFVLTRSVRDTAAVLDAVSGMATGDPYTAPPPLRRYVEEVGAPVERLRVGFRTETPDGEPSCPDVVAAVEATARLLEQLGHTVAPDAVPALDNGYGTGFATLLFASVARDVQRWSVLLGRDITDELEPLNQMFARHGAEVRAVDCVRRARIDAGVDAARCCVVGGQRPARRADEPRPPRSARHHRADEHGPGRRGAHGSPRHVHRALRRDRPARDLAADALERRRSADRRAARGRLRTRRRAPARRLAARRRATMGGTHPAGAREPLSYLFSIAPRPAIITANPITRYTTVRAIGA